MRHRAVGTSGAGPSQEVQLIEFTSGDALQSVLTDRRRPALAAERDCAVARTKIVPVTVR